MAEVEFKNEEDFKSEHLEETVEPEDELKEFLVDYVGRRYGPAENEVTVEMILDILSVDFPEILLGLAEQNFMRGYEQAVADYDFEDSKETTEAPGISHI